MSSSKILKGLSKNFFIAALIFALALQNNLQAQEKITEKKQAVTYMTWNKNTPESEMNDDIKALKKQGIDIKYSDLKRNTKGEITAIKVEFKDNEGNTGNMAYSGKNPIAQIQFHKTPDSVGFGQEDRGFNGMASNFGWINDDMNRGFNFNDMPRQHFEFETEKDFDSKGEKGSKSFGKSNSKIIIQKNGKKPLVIENGEVVEGGEGYTKEEIEEIKQKNKVEFDNGEKGNFHFNFNPNDFFNGQGMDGFKEQFDRLQRAMDKMRPQLMEIEKNKKESNDSENVEQTKKELEKAREEMLKARDEMNKAREEMQKTKTEMKVRKA